MQCPDCKKWFRGYEITKDKLQYDYELMFAEFECPVCGNSFGGIQHADKPNVEEIGYPEVYQDCLTKKEVWQ